MIYKRILGKSLLENVSNLYFDIDWKNVDESLADMFTKVMVTYLDMLGTVEAL